MALGPLAESTLQAALLGALSNVLAQFMQAYKNGGEFQINWIPVFQFLLFSVISTPPNYLWQEFLERMFPAYPETFNSNKSDEKKPLQAKLSIRNTVIKLALDQSISASLNTLLFSIVNRTLQASMAHAPAISNIFKAVSYWTSAGSLDFQAVDFAEVWRVSCDEFWPILMAGWKFWPGIALVNYTMIKEVQNRNLMGALAGVAWGTYMSLVASA